MTARVGPMREARQALIDLMGMTRVPNLATPETIAAFADVILAEGWRRPEQIRQSKDEAWYEGAYEGRVYQQRLQAVTHWSYIGDGQLDLLTSPYGKDGK